MCNDVRRRLLAGWCICLATSIAGPLPCPADEPAVDPRLKALVDRHLGASPNYKPGDLLSRGSIEPIYAELIEMGVQPFEDHERAYGVFLRDGDFLVQLLRSPQGIAFMRSAGRLPEAYDRMERLSWIPAGRAWLQQMVAAENGAELFADLISEQGLKSIEETLQDDPRGQNIRLPTGHIHTEAEFLAELQRTLTERARKAAKAP